MTFDKMIEVKRRPPSRKAQFCTEILKLRPQKRWLVENVTDDYERYTGLRRDESGAPCVPGIKPRIDSRGTLSIHNWIDEVVAWSKTDFGGLQFNILRNLDTPSCESQFGLCE